MVRLEMTGEVVASRSQSASNRPRVRSCVEINFVTDFPMLPTGYSLAQLGPGDYDAALALWNSCEGVRANETREEFARILERNAGLSGAIHCGNELAAAVLCC